MTDSAQHYIAKESTFFPETKAHLHLVGETMRRLNEEYEAIYKYLKVVSIDKDKIDYTGKKRPVFQDDRLCYKPKVINQQYFKDLVGSGFPDEYYDLFTAMHHNDLHTLRGMTKKEHRNYVKKTDKKRLGVRGKKKGRHLRIQHKQKNVKFHTPQPPTNTKVDITTSPFEVSPT